MPEQEHAKIQGKRTYEERVGPKTKKATFTEGGNFECKGPTAVPRSFAEKSLSGRKGSDKRKAIVAHGRLSKKRWDGISVRKKAQCRERKVKCLTRLPSQTEEEDENRQQVRHGHLQSERDLRFGQPVERTGQGKEGGSHGWDHLLMRED